MPPSRSSEAAHAQKLSGNRPGTVREPFLTEPLDLMHGQWGVGAGARMRWGRSYRDVKELKVRGCRAGVAQQRMQPVCMRWGGEDIVVPEREDTGGYVAWGKIRSPRLGSESACLI